MRLVLPGPVDLDPVDLDPVDLDPVGLDLVGPRLVDLDLARLRLVVQIERTARLVPRVNPKGNHSLKGMRPERTGFQRG